MKRTLFVLSLGLILVGVTGCAMPNFKSNQSRTINNKTNSTTPKVTNPTPEATPVKDDVLLEVTNIYGCSYTNTINFQLAQDSHVTKWRTWYNWEQNEEKIEYALKKDGELVHQGQLLRKDCDTYQKQWCQASDLNFDKDLTKGNYEVSVPQKRICQNSASQNQGFITIMGYKK